MARRYWVGLVVVVAAIAGTISFVASPVPPSDEGAVDPQQNDVVRLRPEAVDWREVEGEVVVLDRNSSTYLAVNATGAALWPEIVRGSKIDELVALLRSRFDVDESRATADVEAFVSMLRQRDLLQR